ncbi:MAG: hypothetical protein IJU19_03595 [Bacteroidales bacterium]|nr:hypothetical protein [Bacteroidales bacterium]
MVTSKEIASYLNLELKGADIELEGFSQLSNIKKNTLVFAKRYSQDSIAALNEASSVMAIVAPEYDGLLRCPYCISMKPRLDFIKAMDRFFVVKVEEGKIHPSAVVEEGALLGQSITIGAHCYVSGQCEIGDGTVLHSNVVLDNKVKIGKHCEIKSGAVIGQSGFGFEHEGDGKPVHFPHVGGVVIGDNVYIGANTCIDRGTLGDTVIENDAKIDNLVHIAHNCQVEEGAFVIAGAILGGGTHVGKNSWLAPNVTVKEQTMIHEQALVGLGAVVLKEVEAGAIMVGNPAHKLEKK